MSTDSVGARLLCRTGPFAGITREIATGVTLGRGQDNDVVIRSPLVSTRHARIYQEGGEYFLEDVGSSNGTRLDGMAVRGRVRLDRLHIISLAQTVDLVFSVVESSPAAARSTGTAARGGAHGMTQMDLDAWGDLPDIEGAVPAPDSQAPEPPAQVPPAPVPPAPVPPAPGRATEVADASGWADLPDLDPPQPRDDDVPFEQRPTMIEEGGAASEPVPPPELAVALPGGPLKTFELREGDNIIGRSADCDITIIDPDNQVSRNHAILRLAGDGITLLDAGSANGTFVDGQRVETAALSVGRSFRLGPHLECTLLQR